MEDGLTWTPDWYSQRQALGFSVAGMIPVSADRGRDDEG